MNQLSALHRIPARALRAADALRLGEVALGVGLLSLGALFALESLGPGRLLALAWYFAGSALFVAAVYFLNSYAGYRADLVNRRFDGLERVDPRLFLTGCLAATAGFVVILGMNNPKVLVLALAAFGLWTLYSWPAVGIKAHPLLGAAIHFTAQLFHFFMGWLAVAAADATAALSAVYLALLFVGAYLNHLVIDYEADARAGGPCPVSRASLARASFLVFAAAAGYWVLLGAGGLIPWWQVVPFAAAFVLQAAAQRLLPGEEGEGGRQPLRYRACYRLFYGVAVVVFVGSKVHYG
jgi:hypothetical protein